MPTVTGMTRVFYEPDTFNSIPQSWPPNGFHRHERIAGWLALVAQGEHGPLAGIAVCYSAKNPSHDNEPPIVTASWDGGPTAAIVAQVLTHMNSFWEPASAWVDWDTPNQVDVHLYGVQLTLHSRSPEYQATRYGVPITDDTPADDGA